MPRQTNKMTVLRPVRPELVMVALAEEILFARHFEKILRRDNIPVKVRNHQEPAGRFRIGLWVPRSLMDRAIRLLKSENALDGFYEALSESMPIDGSD